MPPFHFVLHKAIIR